jgi:hypothetical protein
MEAAAKATHPPRTALRAAIAPRSVPRGGAVPAPGCSGQPKLSVPPPFAAEPPEIKISVEWGGLLLLSLAQKVGR